VHLVRHDLAGEHVEHEVEEEEHPHDRSRKIGDVPGPELIGRCCAVARHGARLRGAGTPPVMLAVLLTQNAIEARFRGNVASLIGEARHNLGGWEGRCARACGDFKHGATLLGAELVGRCGARSGGPAIGLHGVFRRPALERA